MKKRNAGLLLSITAAIAVGLMCSSCIGEAPPEEKKDAGVFSESELNALDERIKSLNTERPEKLGAVKVGNYKGISFDTVEVLTITEDDIIEYLTSGSVDEYCEPAETIQKGDLVNIDFFGTVEGEAFNASSGAGFAHAVGSSGIFVDGFDDGLMGKRAGESFELELTFPKDYYDEAVAGKDVVYEVTVNDIQRPDLKAIREFLQDYVDFNSKQQIMYDALRVITADSEYEFTEQAITYEENLFAQNYDNMYRANYGQSLATMLFSRNMTLEDFREIIREDAVLALKQTATIEEIIRLEGIVAQETDIQEYAEINGFTPTALKELVSEDDLARVVAQYMAADVIIEHADINYLPKEEHEEKFGNQEANVMLN